MHAAYIGAAIALSHLSLLCLVTLLAARDLRSSADLRRAAWAHARRSLLLAAATAATALAVGTAVAYAALERPTARFTGVVTAVPEGSLASGLGIRSGDRVTAVNGSPSGALVPDDPFTAAPASDAQVTTRLALVRPDGSAYEAAYTEPSDEHRPVWWASGERAAALLLPPFFKVWSFAGAEYEVAVERPDLGEAFGFAWRAVRGGLRAPFNTHDSLLWSGWNRGDGDRFVWFGLGDVLLTEEAHHALLGLTLLAAAAWWLPLLHFALGSPALHSLSSSRGDDLGRLSRIHVTHVFPARPITQACLGLIVIGNFAVGPALSADVRVSWNLALGDSAACEAKNAPGVPKTLRTGGREEVLGPGANAKYVFDSYLGSCVLMGFPAP